MDRELVLRAKSGDKIAFSMLADERMDRLFAVARLIVRRDDEASDAVQEALLRAWSDVRGLRDPERFDAWLYRLVVRACYRVASRRRQREVREIAVSDFGMVLADPDAQQHVADKDQLERAFRRLTPEQRAVIVLHHYLGLTMAESAEILSIPLGTVQSRLSRATLAMRALLEADARPATFAKEHAR